MNIISTGRITLAETMLKNKQHANGQKRYELVGNRLAYYFKNGKVKDIIGFSVRTVAKFDKSFDVEPAVAIKALIEYKGKEGSISIGRTIIILYNCNKNYLNVWSYCV